MNRLQAGRDRERCVSHFTLRWLSKKCNVAKKNPHGDEKAPAGQRYNSALPALQDTGPSTSCLHPSSIARGGSFFGQGPLFGTIHKSPPLCKGSASRGGRGG